MIGVRLKEERERLSLTQPAFAEVAGAAKRTLIEWEKGTTSPSAVQLSALSAIGVDVFYILTGQRMPTFTGVLAGQDRAGYGNHVLSKDEEALVENYRASSAEGKSAIKTTSASLAQSAKMKKEKAA